MAQNRSVALVTGGRRGIGLGCAVALAGRGFDIVIHALDLDEEVSAGMAVVEAAGARVACVYGNIANLDVHSALLRDAIDSFGRLDCLVNNAGVSALSRGDLLDVSPESFDRCAEVNLRGTFFLTQRFARYLLNDAPAPNGHRSIVVIASANAHAPALTRGEYCISKAGLGMMAKLFALRLAEAGVGVYDIRPGIIRTEMTAPVRGRYDAFIADGGVPMQRWGEPEDIGRAVAAAAAGDLPYTVGQPLYLDGGLTLPHF